MPISDSLPGKLRAAIDEGATAVRRTAKDPPMSTPRRNFPDTTRTRQSPDDKTSRTEDDLTTQNECNRTSRRSRNPTPRPNRSARRRTSDIDVFIDGHSITALVDTGADYSVNSGTFATKLKKVQTAWRGPEIRNAGGHLITSAGLCAARVAINKRTYPASFVLQRCETRDGLPL